MSKLDINGRAPQVGDIIYRYASYGAGFYIVTKFSRSGNIMIKDFYEEVATSLVKLSGYTGYITTSTYVICDTPNVFDNMLEAFNEERKKLGREPLKKYGDS